MRIVRPALGVAIVGAAIAAAWCFWPASQPTAKHNAENVAGTARAPGEQTANSARPSAVVDVRLPAPSPAEPETTASASASTPARSPLPGEAPVTVMTQLLEEVKPHAPPDFAEIERAFAAEPVDETWAPGAEASLLEKVAQIPGLALSGLRAECRSTMCRLKLTNIGGVALMGRAGPRIADLESALGLKVGWFMARTDAGNAQTVLYLWREGMGPQRGGKAAPK